MLVQLVAEARGVNPPKLQLQAVWAAWLERWELNADPAEEHCVCALEHWAISPALMLNVFKAFWGPPKAGPITEPLPAQK